MSRRQDTISRSKYPKRSKGGYKFNRNGVPLDRKGNRALNTPAGSY
jgi:hypothetical protein